MTIKINCRSELFRWGPIDGKVIYPDFFSVAFTEFPKYFNSWPDLAGLFFDEKMVYLCEYPKLRASGEELFKKIILKNSQRMKWYRLWHANLKQLLDLQNDISNLRLSRLSGDELQKKYNLWSKLYLKFWSIGELPEVANWGGEKYLTDLLKKKLKGNDFIYAFEKLSAPENMSFYQKAELDLLKLKRYERTDVFDKKIKRHQERYFWILNSYHHTKVLSQKYFVSELKNKRLQQCQKKIKNILALSCKVKREKEKIFKKYKLGQQIAKAARCLSFCIWWQDLRKYYIFLANHYIDIFLKEFERRLKVKFEDLQYYNVYEMSRLADSGKIIGKTEMARRKKHFVVYYNMKKNNLSYLSGKRAGSIIKKYLNVDLKEKKGELSGVVVSIGKKVTGRARIVTSAKNIRLVKKGEILVATMTSPDYVIGMRKAAAVVTDEGGMTSHAAIVSRELGIPCIVGTKNATKVFKNGNYLEIDTEKGIIKKL
ncbi:hypothetical protein C4569_03410 [Candidatus Parcubacteria bacterium]|nr:MAG: hypothetical protein C4569_03410 [Candidatus Parcubacteria bacterium]